MSDLFEGIFIIFLTGIFLIFFLNYIDIDNTRNNENTIIIVYDNSGEIIYKNLDSYRFGNFGISFTKDGKRIVTKNYQLILNDE